MSDIPDFKTLEEAKRWLRANWDEGVHCPACGQDVKRYKRKLSSGMATALIRLYHKSGGNTLEWVHISELQPLNGGEFAQLKRWQFIDEHLNEDETKRTSGTWRMTNRGIDFVRGKIKARSHVWTYNGKTVGWSDEHITIQQALGDKFNYTELMRGGSN